MAAITVPSLIEQNYKRTQITKLQKAYAALEIAAQNIAAQTGCLGRDMACTKLVDYNEWNLQPKVIQLGGFKVVQSHSGGYIYLKPLNYKKTNAHIGNIGTFFTTPDYIAYHFYAIKEYGESHYKTNALGVYVVTDKTKLYNEEGKVIVGQQGMGTSDAILGRNTFRFIIYDNFKVEPLSGGFGGKVWPMSKKDYYNKADAYKKYCDPNNTDIGVNSSGTACTEKIVRDGWKMKY